MPRAQPYDRDAALDAALTLFWRKGYYATSLKDIEAALNMKPGSIYAAFNSKETLFGLTLERYFRKQHADFVSTLKAAASPLQGLADYLRRFARLPLDDPQRSSCMLVKTLLGATEQDAKLGELAGQYIDQMIAEMAAAFEQAKQLGELPGEADAAHLARRYQADLTALGFEASRRISREELAVSAEELAQKVEAMRVRQT
ncbi:TetR/AcrR family transcriptional regulator [Leisingera sp. ANG-M7]|uniref:TetR/AcrR family transcriptional regulator n=1 Tax=Leisingera sp. ANG-M7 TaxID=1577902 RepID=UPI00057D91E2|nr:TetR/AcrR family transcriptional regulator [Leisingera sp. ANG-M7]KIC35833.1 TetR family transcriptional regulator [Leisingera sp. ANG-M7]